MSGARRSLVALAVLAVTVATACLGPLAEGMRW
jgi:hypothetical protein